MTTRPSVRRTLTGFFAPALIALLFVVRCSDGFRQDELECQQAAQQLESCCPNFDPSTLSCAYANEGCQTSYPALSIGESQCIENESCDELVKSGVCARAAEALPMQTTSDGGMTDDEAVCP